MAHPVMWFEVPGKDGDALRNFYANCSAGRSTRTTRSDTGWLTPEPSAAFPAASARCPRTRPWTTFYVETPDVTASLGTPSVSAAKS